MSGPNGDPKAKTYWYQVGDLVKAPASMGGAGGGGASAAPKVKKEGGLSPIKVKKEGKVKTEKKRAGLDASGDEDCQVEERQSKRPSVAVSPTVSPALPGSDDVMVTGSDDPSMSFAHARHNCRVPGMQFSAQGALMQNMRHCPNCFCFVCDVEASKCQDWGQHCMADESARWMSMRKARKDGVVSVPSAAMHKDPFLQKLPTAAEKPVPARPAGLKPAKVPPAVGESQCGS